MASRRRWFQFSLRGFLVVLTIGCLWLGWKVEKARRRGKAIDALVLCGGWVAYQRGPQRVAPGGEDSLVPGTNHFWLDLREVPVSIEFSLGERPSPKAGSYLSEIYSISALDLTEWSEAELQQIESLDGGCVVIVSDFVTPTAIDRLRRKLSHCKVSIGSRKAAL